jgi:putative flippase GtrA
MPPSTKNVSASVLAKFSFTGMLNTAVDFAVFAALIWGGCSPTTAHTASTALATLNSFVLNRNWTFHNARHQSDIVRLVKFVTLNLISYSLSLGALLAASAEGLTPLVAKTGALVVTMTVNFAGNRWWVFPPAEEVLQAVQPGTQTQSREDDSWSR